MNVVEVCAGIGGFSLAATWMGWDVVGHVELDPFCSRVLKHHWPDALHINDLREVKGDEFGAVDLLCGGIPCFADGTLVLTESGYRPIESVAVGDFVLTHLGRWRRVTSVMVREDADLVSVSAQGVPGVITTPEHPFYARDTTGFRPRRTTEPAWVDAGDIRASHYLAQVLPGGRHDTDALADTDSLTGERPSALETRSDLVASKQGGTEPCGAGADEPRSAAFWWLVGRYLADGWRTERSHRPWTGRVAICCAHDEADELNERIIAAGLHGSRTIQQTATRFTINRSEFYHFLEPFGQYAHGKRIPGFALDLDQERSLALLEGYLSGDGYTDRKGRFRRATTASRALALGIALIAQRALGVVASIRRVATPPRTTIDGRDVGQRDWYAVQIPYRNRSAFIDGDYGWKKVKSVEPCGRGRVYNLSVDEDESYCAEGAVVHNCQPFSVAGKQGGAADDRHLWPEVDRIIQVMRPRYVVIENVTGFIGLALDQVLTDLEAQGYATGTVVLPAAGVNAPHRRDRVWIVAHADRERCTGWQVPAGQQQLGTRGAPLGELEPSRAVGSRAHVDDAQGAGRGLRDALDLGPVAGDEHAPGHASDDAHAAHATPRGIRRGSAPGEAGQPAQPAQPRQDVSHATGEGFARGRVRGGDAASGEMGVSDASNRGKGNDAADTDRPRSQGHGSAIGERAEVASPGDFRGGSECNNGHEALGGMGISHDGPPGRLAGRAIDPRYLDPRWNGNPMQAFNEDWEAGVPRVTQHEPERVAKLKALGNALVPQVAYVLFQAIEEGA